MYDSRGKKMLNPATGQPMKRHADDPLECEICPKIPPGEPKNRLRAVEFNDRGKQAYAHYRRCEAVRRWPDDEAVEFVATVVVAVEKEAKEIAETQRTIALMKATLAGAGKSIVEGFGG